MRKILLLLILFIVALSTSSIVKAAEDYISQNVSEAKANGTARYQFLFMDIYDATLYAPKSGWSFSSPFALKLKYLRNLSGKKIADRSAKEIRQQGFTNEVKLADWHAQMTNIFPDVKNNTTLTGIYKPNDETVFYKNGIFIGRVKDPEFGKWFFGIWLSENTSEPEFRKALLGKKRS